MKTHVISIAIVLSSLSALIVSCGNSETKKEEPSTESSTVKTYACPMHPEITNNKPGACSECGMDLEEVKK